MFSRWAIRYKLGIGVLLLVLVVLALAVSGIVSVSSYRQLARTVSHRAAELPLADELTRSATDLRDTIVRATGPKLDIGGNSSRSLSELQLDFTNSLDDVKLALREYRELLLAGETTATGIDDKTEELETCRQIEQHLEVISSLASDEHWAVTVPDLLADAEDIYTLASSLPDHLRSRMRALKENVRGAYHTLQAITWSTSALAIAMLIVSLHLFYIWVLSPLRILVHGSRQVAAGDFRYRIKLPNHDEMSELAAAMNNMTRRFCEIRDDLDRQVQERTKEVVRSEQLASVGFLAAGVAHEINNPLASIAMCAESLESRLRDIIHEDDAKPDDQHNPEVTVLRNYLRRIQDEAFRCSGITAKLLDFSRIGDVERQDVDLNEVVDDVIDMLKTIDRYKSKHIEFARQSPVLTHVNAQELKQVVLNLVTNALDCLDADGTVTVTVAAGESAELTVADNGCGMTEEVLEHLFEPFFTRRRDGQGTGLGLSISYRIVSDHGGTIVPTSAGLGHGSKFRVTLPLASSQHEPTHERVHQAA